MGKMRKSSIVLLIIAAVGLVFGILMLVFSLRKPKNEGDNQRKNEIHTHQAEKEVRKIEDTLDIRIHRYDKALFSINPDSPSEGMKRVAADYPAFLIDSAAWRNPNYIRQISGFLKDPYIKEIYQDVNKQFGDLQELQKSLDLAFAYYLYYFPTSSVPEFYTLIEGIDASPEAPKFMYAYNQSVVLMLDWYLGKDYKYYKDYNIPQYIRLRCEKKYVAIDCFRNIIANRHLPEATPITLLDNMIEEGKTIYFTELMFPDQPVADIIGYTSEQLAWAEAHQADVWNYLIEKEMVFSKSDDVIRRMVGLSPETKPFKNSPGRMGSFIGWKIVTAYMESHPDVSISDLMGDGNGRKILDSSGYKPLK